MANYPVILTCVLSSDEAFYNIFLLCYVTIRAIKDPMLAQYVVIHLKAFPPLFNKTNSHLSTCSQLCAYHRI